MNEVIALQETAENFVTAVSRTAADVKAQLRASRQELGKAETIIANLDRLLERELGDDELDLFLARRSDAASQREAKAAQVEFLEKHLESVRGAQANSYDAEMAVAWLRAFADEVAGGFADAEDIDRMRVVASRVIEKVVVHEDSVPGTAFTDGSLTGSHALEVIWRHDAVLASPSFSYADDGETTGSPYPQLQRASLFGIAPNRANGQLVGAAWQA